MTVERPVEVELKYAVADRSIGERLLNAETLAGFRPTGAPRPTQHEDRYVDSADGALARAGFAARLRTSGEGTIISVKSTMDGTGSMHRREELEGPADRTSDASGWPASGARSLILELCGDSPLVEVVTIRQFRRKRDLELATGEAAVELSLDEVDVVSHGRVVERFLELELELTRGSILELAPLQALLDGHHGLRPAPESKLERALEATGRGGRSGRGAVGYSAAPDSDAEIVAEAEAIAVGDAAQDATQSEAIEGGPQPTAGAEPAGSAASAEAAPTATADPEPTAEAAATAEPETTSEAGSIAEAEPSAGAEPLAATDGDAPDGLVVATADSGETEASRDPSETAAGEDAPAATSNPESPAPDVPATDPETAPADDAATDEVPVSAGTLDVLTFDEEDLLEESPGHDEPLDEDAAVPDEAIADAEPEPLPAPTPIRPAPRSRTPEDGPIEGAVIDLDAIEHTQELIAEAQAAAGLVIGPPPGVDLVGEIPVGKTPGVTAEDLHAEAGRKVLRFHLARMIAREPGTREGSDPEELHAMRVSTRRMRAAWRVFGDAYRPDRTDRFRRRLRTVAARLGAVRDLDVLIEATEAFAETLPAGERDGLTPLLDAWRSQRENGRRLLIEELDSNRHRRFVEDYRDFAMTPGSDVRPIDPTSPHRVRDTAGSRIWTAYEQVRAYESVLKWADVPTLHRLRIEAKRLRYTLEFVREALGPEAPALISRVVALQDHLGAMNDAEVGAHMARAFLVEHAGELSDVQAAAISRYLVTREREVARLKRTVGLPWRSVAGLTFRRALGRTIAQL